VAIITIIIAVVAISVTVTVEIDNLTANLDLRRSLIGRLFTSNLNLEQ